MFLKDLRAAKNLIRFGISDPNQVVLLSGRHGESAFAPIALAAALDNEEVLAILMEHADKPARAFGDFTPLKCAIDLHSEKALSFLLSKDLVDANSLGNSKWTPLMAAMSSNRGRAVQLLLDSKKVNIQLKGPLGLTHLSLAALWANKAIFDMISVHGSSFNIADLVQRTTLFFAIKGGNHEIVDSILSDPTVSVMAPDIYGAIPLTLAARLGDIVSSAMLLRENARAQLIHRDKFGRTALAWAAYYSNSATRDFLSRKCKEFGVSSGDENTCPIIRQIKRADGHADVCTVCFLDFGRGELFYSCRRCWDGRFRVCYDCRNRQRPQARCLQETHTLKLVQRIKRK